MAEPVKVSAFIMGHSSPEMFPNSAESLPGDLVTALLAHTIDWGQNNVEERKHPPVACP